MRTDLEALQARAKALHLNGLLLPVEQSGNPASRVGVLPMGEQAIEMQGFGAGLQGVEISPHRGSP